MKHYGIKETRDRSYAVAACLTYWVFKCRDRKHSPAMGVNTWTFLESSVRNSAEISTNLEDYLQALCDKLFSHLRPFELTKIINPSQRILRINEDATEIKELPVDKQLVFMGWLDLLEDAKPYGFSEWDVLEILRTKAGIIQVLCRLRFEEDKALGLDVPDEFIEVEATNV